MDNPSYDAGDRTPTLDQALAWSIGSAVGVPAGLADDMRGIIPQHLNTLERDLRALGIDPPVPLERLAESGATSAEAQEAIGRAVQDARPELAAYFRAAHEGVFAAYRSGDAAALDEVAHSIALPADLMPPSARLVAPDLAPAERASELNQWFAKVCDRFGDVYKPWHVANPVPFERP